MVPMESSTADMPSSERRRTLLDVWQRSATATFLDAYHTVAEAGPHSWLLASGEQGVLDIFLIEKVAYEIGYELANRPAWLRVPLGGLERLARRLLA
jgi:maltose alpha-D-glucosyltransferase/alpha-amylase